MESKERNQLEDKYQQNSPLFKNFLIQSTMKSMNRKSFHCHWAQDSSLFSLRRLNKCSVYGLIEKTTKQLVSSKIRRKTFSSLKFHFISKTNQQHT